jgi:hypothetical protein
VHGVVRQLRRKETEGEKRDRRQLPSDHCPPGALWGLPLVTHSYARAIDFSL